MVKSRKTLSLMLHNVVWFVGLIDEKMWIRKLMKLMGKCKTKYITSSILKLVILSNCFFTPLYALIVT